RAIRTPNRFFGQEAFWALIMLSSRVFGVLVGKDIPSRTSPCATGTVHYEKTAPELSAYELEKA
ncbi:MAG: hypothetical protein JTT11_02945, partial [Candidatus Brockarchaeota archaeon]|nr:hypothetical protein [Candidatus Brockarchaeota archaeon]